jgi:hypothetical protein
LTGGGVQEGL